MCRWALEIQLCAEFEQPRAEHAIRAQPGRPETGDDLENRVVVQHIGDVEHPLHARATHLDLLVQAEHTTDDSRPTHRVLLPSGYITSRSAGESYVHPAGTDSPFPVRSRRCVQQGTAAPDVLRLQCGSSILTGCVGPLP